MVKISEIEEYLRSNEVRSGDIVEIVDEGILKKLMKLRSIDQCFK